MRKAFCDKCDGETDPETLEVARLPHPTTANVFDTFELCPGCMLNLRDWLHQRPPRAAKEK